MKMLLVFVMFMFVGLLAGCADESAMSQAEVKELVADLSGSDKVSAASIDDQNLTVEDEGEKSVYPLPEDEFFYLDSPLRNIHASL
nr:hypothetical protein [Planococcus maritimus]